MNMKNTTKISDGSSEVLDIQSRIEIATQSLDRNMSLVSGCDSKASIALTLFGVLLGVVMSDRVLTKIINVISNARNLRSTWDSVYLLCLLIPVSMVAFGLWFIASVLFARGTKTERRNDLWARLPRIFSTIFAKEEKEEYPREYYLFFFGGISNKKYYKDYADYSTQFKAMTKENVLNAVLHDLYENAVIADKKYRYYNKGLKLTAGGFFLFAAWLLIGIIVY